MTLSPLQTKPWVTPAFPSEGGHPLYIYTFNSAPIFSFLQTWCWHFLVIDIRWQKRIGKDKLNSFYRYSYSPFPPSACLHITYWTRFMLASTKQIAKLVISSVEVKFINLLTVSDLRFHKWEFKIILFDSSICWLKRGCRRGEHTSCSIDIL